MHHVSCIIFMKRAVVLLSGGIDSSTTAAIARHEGYEVYALSFDYNQRHKVELEAAKKVALSLKVKKHLVIKFDLREIGGSALTSDMEVPKDRMQDTGCRIQDSGDKIQDTGYKMQDKKIMHHASCIMHRSPCIVHHESSISSAIPVTYVPARNTIFLSFALGWAEALKAEDIFIGANAVDYSGYPDCRPEYLKAFEKMANLATKASVEEKIRFAIEAPLLYLTKAEIIKKGAELGLDYSLTWSCYDPQKDRNPSSVISDELKQNTHDASRITHHGYVPCGRCDSCLFRARGFKEAGIKDI